ncbi:hypothetical protein BGZ60DRAFT_422665 [Tricladium varicosporioides]|nr:hypothetical protein BGZ60DRAFT_422665 [Hymenoscyphus varicosporioides]
MQLISLLLAAAVATTVTADFHLVTLHRSYKVVKDAGEDPLFKGLPIPNAASCKRSSPPSRRRHDLNIRKGGEPDITTVETEEERVAVFVPSKDFNCPSMLSKQNLMSLVRCSGGDVDFQQQSGFYGNCGAKKLNFYQTGDTLQVFEDGQGTKYADCYKDGSQTGKCKDTLLEKISYSDTWVCPSFLCK